MDTAARRRALSRRSRVEMVGASSAERSSRSLRSAPGPIAATASWTVDRRPFAGVRSAFPRNRTSSVRNGSAAARRTTSSPSAPAASAARQRSAVSANSGNGRNGCPSVKATFSESARRRRNGPARRRRTGARARAPPRRRRTRARRPAGRSPSPPPGARPRPSWPVGGCGPCRRSSALPRGRGPGPSGRAGCEGSPPLRRKGRRRSRHPSNEKGPGGSGARAARLRRRAPLAEGARTRGRAASGSAPSGSCRRGPRRRPARGGSLATPGTCRGAPRGEVRTRRRWHRPSGRSSAGLRRARW